MNSRKLDRARVWVYRKGYWAHTRVWGWFGYLWFHVLPAKERGDAKRGFWEGYHKAQRGEDVVIPGKGRNE